MKKESISIIVSIQIAMTVLLAYDFFPGAFNLIAVPKTIILVMILLLVSISIFFSRSKTTTLKQTFIWQLLSTGYLLLLIVVFTMLGGVSQSEISLENPVLWIILAISMMEIFRQKKRLRSADSVKQS